MATMFPPISGGPTKVGGPAGIVQAIRRRRPRNPMGTFGGPVPGAMTGMTEAPPAAGPAPGFVGASPLRGGMGQTGVVGQPNMGITRPRWSGQGGFRALPEAGVVRTPQPRMAVTPSPAQSPMGQLPGPGIQPPQVRQGPPPGAGGGFAGGPSPFEGPTMPPRARPMNPYMLNSGGGW